MPKNNRALFYLHKGNCCGACGTTVQEMVERFGTFHRLFELNHIDPAKKHPKYKNLIERKILSTEQLDELDKCVLLCVQCHKGLTAQNQTVTLLVTVTRKGKTFQQRLKGQLISDNHVGTSFFTDEEFLFFPYLVRLGAKRPLLRFLGELKQNIDRYIARSRREGILLVEELNGREVFSAKRLDDNIVQLSFDPRFPLASLEATFRAKHPKHDMKIWVRKGSAIFSQGYVRKHGVRVTCKSFYSEFDKKTKSKAG